MNAAKSKKKIKNAAGRDPYSPFYINLDFTSEIGR